SDIRQNVETVAVNLWSRFFDKATGKPKDAYVLSLRVGRSRIVDIDIVNADALTAFRELGGTFVFSLEQLVPIEPLIRLDREDLRFVQGREVLGSIEQGENLATMDWQDFEHLIRELFEKEFSRRGGEVKITRASRDRGVDAVAFDPDPLRG